MDYVRNHDISARDLHLDNTYQTTCADAFNSFLWDNGLYEYVLAVFKDGRGRCDIEAHFALYLRFTYPTDFVLGIIKTPPPEFADLELLWQELLTYID